MESLEAAAFWRYIAGSLDRLVAILDGLGETELNWRPPAEGANSLYVLAWHTLANAEENILGTLCGQSVTRDRTSEFAMVGTTAEPLHARWRELRGRLEAALSTVPAATLDEPRAHSRRGEVQGRDVLIVVARHVAEHLGQAKLTRDLMKVALRR